MTISSEQIDLIKKKVVIKLILGFLLLPALASGYTIKATGHIRVRIVAPEIAQNETPTVVYTEVGPTAQVVF